MGRAQDLLDELEDIGHCINHGGLKWFQRADIEKIVEAMRQSFPKPVLTFDVGNDPEGKRKYWAIPQYREVEKWVKEWMI